MSGQEARRAEFVNDLKIAAEKNPAIAEEVSETFSYTGDKPFHGRLQVAALGTPQSRFTRIDFVCKKSLGEGGVTCDNKTSLDFTDPSVRPSAFATYFDTNNPVDGLRVHVESGISGIQCHHGWTCWEIKGSQERAVTTAFVVDLQGAQGRAWFVHSQKCDLRRGPNWIIAEGSLCRGKMGKIGVLVHAFTPESEVSKPRPEDEDTARTFLRSLAKEETHELAKSVLWRVAEALARRSQLKGNEIVRGYVADLLTVLSPTWVRTPEGAAQLGATTSELGPTTAAKSQRIRMLRDMLECGKYDTGRKTVAGLTAGAEKMEGGEWLLRKGLLPSWDLSWAVLDNMPPHALDSQIESRRDGIVSITAIRSAELWARVRLKLLSNPAQPFDEVFYKCTLLKVYDPKLVARFLFSIYTYGVSKDERYNSRILEAQPGDEELLAAAKTVLRGNLSRETTFLVPSGLWPLIMERSKSLEEKYGCEDIPLLLRSIPYKIAVLTYNFALSEGDEPRESHVELAYAWLDYCASDIELDKYVVWWRSQHGLSDAEYKMLTEQIETEIAADLREHGGTREETYTHQLIGYLAKNTTGQRDELAAHLNVDVKTVTRKANLLKGQGLLRSDQTGYHFTAKGIRLFRRWFDVPDVPHVPTLEGLGGVRVGTLEGAIAPETGDTRDMKDMTGLIVTSSQISTTISTPPSILGEPDGINEPTPLLNGDVTRNQTEGQPEPQPTGRLNIPLIRDLLRSKTIGEESIVGYATWEKLIHHAEVRFGDKAAEIVPRLLKSLIEEGFLVEAPFPRCYKSRKLGPVKP